MSILLQKLEAKYPFLKPDLTLALIGINGDPEHFTPYALPFLKLLKDRSKALAVVSAVTPEDNWYLLAKRKEMKRVSQELKAPYLPLHEKIRGTGINADDWLWWDNCCHLTDSGQRWVAEEIYSFLEPHL